MGEVNYIKRNHCRSCGHAPLELVLDLREVPLADALLDQPPASPEEEVKVPLSFGYCSACGLAQILEDVDPDLLFARYYPYYSSTSPQLSTHFLEAAHRIMAGRKSGKVLEIASNDGVMLRVFKQEGWTVLGVDPAPGPAEFANKIGIETHAEFFNDAYARKLLPQWGKAEVIIGNNVLAHVPDPNALVKGVAHLLEEKGIAVFEFPYLGDLVAHAEFDTIFHQHYSYFSLHSVKALFERNGLFVCDVDRIPIHGGSLRLTVAKQFMASERVSALLEEERRQGLGSRQFFSGFADRVQKNGLKLLELLRSIKAAGKRIAGYGAAGKANTLMSYYEIDSRYLDCIGDISIYKQGKFFPGNHLPIVSPEQMLATQPDYMLILAWNFKEPIMRQFSAYHAAGGKFIIPLPVPEIC